jgi:hypothetical protein
VTIAAIEHLQEIWPLGVAFEDLLAAIAPRIPEDSREEARDSLAGVMLRVATMGLADLRTRDVSVASRVGERPVASQLARMEAQEGDVITTLLHRSIHMEDELGRRFIQLLDGTRDHRALVDALAPGYPAVPRDTIDAQVRSNLLDLCRLGVLIA